jgi:large subunit ribosomal protein L19e
MNLGKKKALARRTLKVGKGRIVFIESRLEDIKEAITKQDIRDLHAEGAILVREIKGRTKITKRKKTPGKIKKNVSTRKQDYVKMTRKLRKYVSAMRERGDVSRDNYLDIRKKIRNRIFKSQAQLKVYISKLNR